jgi:hypothetical protein
MFCCVGPHPCGSFAFSKYAGMLRLVSEILPSIESAKQCEVTVEICKGGGAIS